jgi:hypothetical protein
MNNRSGRVERPELKYLMIVTESFFMLDKVLTFYIRFMSEYLPVAGTIIVNFGNKSSFITLTRTLGETWPALSQDTTIEVDCAIRGVAI